MESVVAITDRNDFPVKIEGNQMTVSSKVNSHTDLRRTDVTRGDNKKLMTNVFVNIGQFSSEKE